MGLSAGVSTSTVSQPSLSASSNSSRDVIISLLNIPAHHVDRKGSANLRTSYAKYLAYLVAKKALDKLVADGKWPMAKDPTREDLVEVFISKSAFFKNYQPYFPYIPNHPVLERWLLNEDDVPSDMETWGVGKNVYGYRDLSDFFKGVQANKEKGKEKKEGKASGSGVSHKKVEKTAGKKKATRA